MNLQDQSIKQLLKIHNLHSGKPAGPKTFRCKADLIRRIEELTANAAAVVPEAPQALQSTYGLVGRLARRVLADPSGTPYEDVAMFVNHFVPGARATAKSVAWYASQMRRKGCDVPKRAPAGSVCVWIEDPATADRWLTDCGVSKKAT